MRTTAARETLTTVLDRLEFVDCLLDGPKGKRELAAELSVSRSTVNRAVRDLETLGLVERVDGTYRATELCRTTATGLEELTDRVADRTRLRELRQWVPEGALDVDLAVPDGFEVLASEPGDPYRMVDRHVRRLREERPHRTVLPLTGLHAYEAIRDRVVEDAVESELVAAPAVADVLLSDPDFEPLTAEMARTDRFRLYETDDPVPYFVGVYGDVTQIGVDADGDPRALYETRDEGVRSWATDRIDRYVAGATRIR
jgi:DNA-binding HxlR family transcriptional regulator